MRNLKSFFFAQKFVEINFYCNLQKKPHLLNKES